MSRTSRRRRRFFEIQSRLNASWDRHTELVQTPESQRRYNADIKCDVCSWPRAEWDTAPIPIDIDVMGDPQGCVDGAPVFPILFREDLFETLKPYLRGNVVGMVRALNTYGELRAVPYVTSYAPRHLLLETGRGRYCRHARCRVCGRFAQMIGWASGAIVERDLDDRLLYHGAYGDLFIDESLAEKLDLRTRFPDIKLYRYDVVPEPLDGDILPGDPGWTGDFHPQPGLPRGPDIVWAGRNTAGDTEDVTGEGWITLYLPQQALAESRLDIDKLMKAMLAAVNASQSGEVEAQGVDARRNAWYVRFHGSNMDRLFEAMRDVKSRFWEHMPDGYYFTGRLRDGRERRISKYAT